MIDRGIHTAGTATTLCLLLLAVPRASLLAGQSQPASGTPQAQVAALKESVQQGMARLRQYEWIETTIISLKGEEKARKQNRCSYASDGTVQKVALDAATPEQSASAGGRRQGGRLKQHVIEKKKDELQDYMERAAGLVRSYVPPDAARIQAAKDAAHVEVEPSSDGRVHFVISDYALPSDTMALDLDLAAGALLGLSVNSYLDSKEDPITLVVEMATLPDGAVYAARTTLEAKAKNIRVVVLNSGHTPVS